MIQATIIIPTLNEERYISSCLDSILASDIDKSTIEVLIVDGVSSDNTVEIIKRYMKKHPFIKLLQNKKKIIPSAINIGIKEAKGKYIIRIDAHSFYPKDYFSKLLYWSKILDADNIGGVCITDIKSKNKKTESIKAVMNHKLGVGGGDYRGEINEPKISNAVPFGCFKKESFLKYGMFDERLERTEDLEINRRILNGGGKVFLVPDVSFTYYTRERFRHLAKKSFLTGKWVVLNAYFTRSLKSLHFYHFIPLIFVLSLLTPLFICSIDKRFCLISVTSLLFYLSVIIYVSFKLKQQNNSFIYLIVTFVILHISYGAGSLVGLTQIIVLFFKGKK